MIKNSRYLKSVNFLYYYFKLGKNIMRYDIFFHVHGYHIIYNMKIRILHFGSNYLPNKGGNVVRMTNMLENNSSDFELFIMTTAEKKEFDDEKYYNDKGIRIIRIKTLKEAQKLLPQIIFEYNINIVVTHIIPANIIACRCLPNDIVIMHEFHSLIDSGKIKNYGKSLLYRFWLDKRISKYFVLSQGAANYINKKYKIDREKIIFLPNGCNLTVTKMRKGNSNYFTYGYVGTFYKWQGIEIIYNNIANILSIADNVRIYLIGGGEFEEELRALSEKYKNRLILTGLINKSEVEEYMNEIDVLMIPRPSTLETETAIPLKIFDSIEYGKPVIISNVYGLREVLSEKEAFMYDAKQANGLYEMCKYIYFHQDSCAIKYNNACSRLISWPTWEKVHEIQNSTFRKVQK